MSFWLWTFGFHHAQRTFVESAEDRVIDEHIRSALPILNSAIADPPAGTIVVWTFSPAGSTFPVNAIEHFADDVEARYKVWSAVADEQSDFFADFHQRLVTEPARLLLR